MNVQITIITTVAAFAPLLFVAGNMGKVMRQIPIVVIMVLLMSLVEALLILPAHLSGEGKIFYFLMGRFLGPIEKVQNKVQAGLLANATMAELVLGIAFKPGCTDLDENLRQKNAQTY